MSGRSSRGLVRIVATGAAIATLYLAGAVHAGDAAAEPHYVMGFKGGFLAGFGHGEEVGLGGAGLFFESAVIPHWLEVEVGLRLLAAEDIGVLPFDLLLKMPFSVDETIAPYVGLGPTMVTVIHEGTNMYFGLVVVGGTYIWAGPWGGVLAEVTYGIIDEHGPRHEVGINLGVAFRW